MVTLYIDTSSEYLLLALKDDDKLQGFLSFSIGKKMSEELLYQVDNMLTSLGYSIDSIDEIVAGIGPGSFTGVRIGVALSQGLSLGGSKKVFGISSLDIQALSSGMDVVRVASQLKGSLYAVKDYDFINDIYSDYYITEIDNKSECEYVLVNTSGKYIPDLFKAVLNKNFDKFKSECLPIYLRKSEAEICLDKKCSNS